MKDFEKYLVNEVSDYDNPEYLFTGVNTSILKLIVNKRVDPVKLAEKEMYQRGLDKNGKWIGFDQAKKYWKIK